MSIIAATATISRIDFNRNLADSGGEVVEAAQSTVTMESSYVTEHKAMGIMSGGAGLHVNT